METDYFNSRRIDILRKISLWYAQYFIIDHKIKVTILCVPSESTKLVVCYIQFDPNSFEINMEQKLYSASGEIYNLNTQLFSVTPNIQYNAVDILFMLKDYINSIFGN